MLLLQISSGTYRTNSWMDGCVCFDDYIPNNFYQSISGILSKSRLRKIQKSFNNRIEIYKLMRPLRGGCISTDPLLARINEVLDRRCKILDTLGKENLKNGTSNANTSHSNEHMIKSIGESHRINSFSDVGMRQHLTYISIPCLRFVTTRRRAQ